MTRRFKELQQAEMTEAQRKAYEGIISGPRGGARGPFNALLRSPDLADRVQRVGEYVRFKSSLPARLNELAIIIVARYWTAQYEWYAHRRLAIQAGLSPATADAIAAGQRPPSLTPDEESIYNFVNEILTTKQVSDATFKATKDRFGERGVVDLIGVSGYYQLVSMLLNVDRYPLPDGTKPELKPLR